MVHDYAFTVLDKDGELINFVASYHSKGDLKRDLHKDGYKIRGIIRSVNMHEFRDLPPESRKQVEELKEEEIFEKLKWYKRDKN